MQFPLKVQSTLLHILLLQYAMISHVMSAASNYRRTDVDEVVGHHETIHLEGM